MTRDPVWPLVLSVVLLGVLVVADLVLGHVCEWGTWTCRVRPGHPFMP
jgi:hypothetical protein